jgi:hypothetical protein
VLQNIVYRRNYRITAVTVSFRTLNFLSAVVTVIFSAVNVHLLSRFKFTAVFILVAVVHILQLYFIVRTFNSYRALFTAVNALFTAASIISTRVNFLFSAVNV